MTSGYTAELGEQDKHAKNDIPCTARGWVCVPLVVEVFGAWWLGKRGTRSSLKGCQEVSHQDELFLA